MYPGSVEGEKRMRVMRQYARYRVLDGDVKVDDTGALDAALAAFVDNGFTPSQQLTGTAEWQRDCEDVRHEERRLRAALARTRPSQRSCEVRLALADWLFRRLRRGGLLTNEQARSKSLLRRYDMLVALLRYTLRSQPNNMVQVTVTAAALCVSWCMPVQCVMQ